MLLYEFLEKKTTPPTDTPTTGVQKLTTASPPTTKTEILPTTPVEKDTKKNATSREAPKVEIDLAANSDPPGSKSSSPVLPIITSVLGTLLLCAVVFFALKKVKRKLCSLPDHQEAERIICVGSSTPIQKRSPVTVKREMYGFVSSIFCMSYGHMAMLDDKRSKF